MVGLFLDERETSENMILQWKSHLTSQCAVLFLSQVQTGKAPSRQGERHLSTICKWTRPFWGTDCRRSPKSLSSAQAASLLQCQHWESSKVLAGFAFCEMPSQYPQCAFQGLSGVPRRVSSSLRAKPSASICSVQSLDFEMLGFKM